MGDETRVFASNAGSIITINGIMIRLLSATPDPFIDGLFELIAEVEYIGEALNADLNVTCSTSGFSRMINIALNSKYFLVT